MTCEGQTGDNATQCRGRRTRGVTRDAPANRPPSAPPSSPPHLAVPAAAAAAVAPMLWLLLQQAHISHQLLQQGQVLQRLAGDCKRGLLVHNVRR